MKTPIKIIFGIYIFSLLYGCKKENEVSLFQVNVQNDYFETIDSVHLGHIYFGTIRQDKVSDIQLLNGGHYQFYCNTSSLLFIQAEVDLKGAFSHITLVIDKTGQLHIKQY